MENLDYTIDGRIVTIRFDTTKELGPSQSGKTILVSKTGKAVRLGNTNVFLNLTAYKYPKGGDEQ